MTTPTHLPAWQALQQDYQQTQSVQMRDQFAQDPDRANRYWLEVGGLTVDFPKTASTTNHRRPRCPSRAGGAARAH